MPVSDKMFTVSISYMRNVIFHLNYISLLIIQIKMTKYSFKIKHTLFHYFYKMLLTKKILLSTRIPKQSDPNKSSDTVSYNHFYNFSPLLST